MNFYILIVVVPVLRAHDILICYLKLHLCNVESIRFYENKQHKIAILHFCVVETEISIVLMTSSHNIS